MLYLREILKRVQDDNCQTACLAAGFFSMPALLFMQRLGLFILMAGNAEAIKVLPQKFINCIFTMWFMAGNTGNLIPFIQGKSFRDNGRDHTYGMVFTYAGRVAPKTGLINLCLYGLEVLLHMAGCTTLMHLFRYPSFCNPDG
jgi:dipeptide/tripeptide permease